MFSALILALTTAALVQFGVFYWRALVVCTAAETISEEVLAAAKVDPGSICGEDYRSLAQLHKLTPELCSKSSSLGLVPAYFKVLQAVKSVAAGRVAALSDWAESESALCRGAGRTPPAGESGIRRFDALLLKHHPFTHYLHWHCCSSGGRRG